MSQEFTRPSRLPDERERTLLTIAVEECAEVQHRVTKVLRFGGVSIEPGQSTDNTRRLSAEVGDLLEIVDALVRQGLIDAEWVAKGRARKREKLARHLGVTVPA